MVTGLAFALAAMMLNSVTGFLKSDATRRVTRGRSLATQPRYLGGLLTGRAASSKDVGPGGAASRGRTATTPGPDRPARASWACTRGAP
jgi:hypothetical protein